MEGLPTQDSGGFNIQGCPYNFGFSCWYCLSETSVLARAKSYIEIQSQMEHALAQDQTK